MSRRARRVGVIATLFLGANACVAPDARGLGPGAPRPLLGLAIEPAAATGRWRLVEGPRVLAEGSRAECRARRLELAEARAGSGRPNLPFPTLGGKQVWADLVIASGWRVQRNVLTGHHRLLDPGDVRRAWGSEAACRVALERERVARGLGPRGRHAVVLLHGLIRAKDMWGDMAEALEAAGYEVVTVNYPSTRAPLRVHAAQLQGVLDELEGVDAVSIVTHSLGGLVARVALASEDSPGGWRDRVRLNGVVMIFPPSQGSVLAESWGENPLFRALMREVGQEVRPARAQRLPRPPCRFTVLAGGRGDGQGRSGAIPGDDDGTVAVAEARLAGGGLQVFDVGHTFGVNDPAVVAATLAFLADDPDAGR